MDEPGTALGAHHHEHRSSDHDGQAWSSDPTACRSGNGPRVAPCSWIRASTIRVPIIACRGHTSAGGVRGAAIGPGHLGEGGWGEFGGAHVAPTVTIVAGIDQPAAILDLIEREA
jgi:hypothetical protein